MKIDPNELARVFRNAKAAALAADPGEGPENDGGSCNLDTPAMKIPRAGKAIEQAAALAGVEVTNFSWFGSRSWYWLHVPLMGQASRRTRMMQAAQRVLNAAAESGRFPGMTACGYMQAD
mgnify:FL=1